MLAFGAFAATSALAASPHFVGTPTATVSGNTLTVNFKAAGLGNDTTVPITLSGDVTVNSRCYTKSGNKPQAANKQETIQVDQTRDFPVRNGAAIAVCRHEDRVAVRSRIGGCRRICCSLRMTAQSVT